jgi:sRNA-binding carbon storage regulator CsrA
MGLVLRRNVGQSVTIYSTVDKSLGVVTITTRGHGVMEIDAPKNLAVMRSELLDEPIVSEPVTKKLGEILHERPHLKVTGIRRLDADCEQIYATAMIGRLHLEMTWHDNWHAWSCRPATGIYQQIIIFIPRSSDD